MTGVSQMPWIPSYWYWCLEAGRTLLGGLKAGSACPDQLLSAFSLKEAQALKRERVFKLAKAWLSLYSLKRDILMIKEDFTLGCKDRIWERGTVMNFLLLLGPRSQDHVCMWMKEVSLRSEKSCFFMRAVSSTIIYLQFYVSEPASFSESQVCINIQKFTLF